MNSELAVPLPSGHHKPFRSQSEKHFNGSPKILPKPKSENNLTRCHPDQEMKKMMCKITKDEDSMTAKNTITNNTVHASPTSYVENTNQSPNQSKQVSNDPITLIAKEQSKSEYTIVHRVFIKVREAKFIKTTKEVTQLCENGELNMKR